MCNDKLLLQFCRMNKQDESCLRKNKYALQKGLKVDEILLGHLNAEEVLSDGVRQDIEVCNSTVT